MSQTWTQARLGPCPPPTPPGRVSKCPSRQFQDTSHISLPTHQITLPPSHGILTYTHLPLMGTHSSTLAWKIPWMEEAGTLQFMGSRRVGLKRLSSRWGCKGHHPAPWQQKSASPCLDPPVTMAPISHLIHSLTGPKASFFPH